MVVDGNRVADGVREDNHETERHERACERIAVEKDFGRIWRQNQMPLIDFIDESDRRSLRVSGSRMQDDCEKGEGRDE